MSITVITNNVPRELISVAQLPADEQKWFDYIEGEDRYSTRIFSYRGSYYDVNEFFVVTRHFDDDVTQALSKWQGIQTDSFFSGTLIRYPQSWDGTTDYESVVVGRYYS